MERIAIIGAHGQVGARLCEFLGTRALPITRTELDLEEHQLIGKKLQLLRPDAIINAAAYTDVEGAENNEALAFRLNANAPRIMAQYAAKAEIPFIHLSTDYVFDGAKEAPYIERDKTNPLNAYGRSKRAGEEAVLAAYEHALVVRTSWVYDKTGKNFLNAIMRKAREAEELSVVADQFGAPTFARDLARALALLLELTRHKPYRGLLHMTNQGETSWHGFAEEIVTHMRAHETVAAKRVLAVPSSAYPTKAQRPKNSLLNCGVLAHAFEITLPTWQDALSRAMKEHYAG